MSITTQCGNCTAKFKAKDALAGKRIKCPKCSNPITVPAANAQAQPAAAATRSVGNYNPILDLLDEAGVKSVPTGPVCENCGTEMHAHSVICVECGFNSATGEQLETQIYDDDDDGIVDTGRTDADKIMAKAEKAIDESPVTAEGQDFGDGADSFVIATIAIIGFLVLIVGGVGIVLSMDWIVDTFELESYQISLFASIVIALGCIIWISAIAFLMNPNQGIICVCTAGLYCIVFGFMQGKQLLIPTIGLLAGILIGIVSYLVGVYGSGDSEFGLLLQHSLASLFRIPA